MSALAVLAAARRAADETAYDAREMEAREIRRLHATGMTAYRIAQETGLTQRAIAKIVGGQVRKRRATAAESKPDACEGRIQRLGRAQSVSAATAARRLPAPPTAAV